MQQPSWPIETIHQESYITIDDVIQLSRNLCEQLCKIGEYKHPLAVRKGVNDMLEQNDSRTVRAGSITYFLDVKQTKEGKPFLVITESRYKGEGENHERKSIVVFQDNMQEFAQALSEITANLE